MGIVARQSIKGTLATYFGVAVGIVTTFFVQTKYLTTEEIGLVDVLLQSALLFSGLAQLGTNTKYISSCINSEAGCPFNEYVNGYRIRYAQQLLRERPGRRLSDVADAAGFSGESSFYRNFKAVTGLTPAEWLAENS